MSIGIDNIRTIYWVVIGALAVFFLLSGVLQGAVELFNAKRGDNPTEQKKAQDGIWNGVIAVAVVLALGGIIWAIVSPQLSSWLANSAAFIAPVFLSGR